MKMCIGFVVLAALLQGCGRTGADHSAVLAETQVSSLELLPAYQKWDPVLVDQLKAKAKALAERELGRMAATEMLYRNVVESQTPAYDQLPSSLGAWVKIYRNFEGYEVKDIIRSDSYLSPIEYEIEYRYTIMSTRPVMSLGAEGAQSAIKNSFFDPVADRTVVYTYKCDAWGNAVGDLPKLLDRVNYYTRDNKWGTKKIEGTNPTSPWPPQGIPAGGFGGAQGFPPTQFPNQPPFPQEAPQPE